MLLITYVAAAGPEVKAFALQTLPKHSAAPVRNPNIKLYISKSAVMIQYMHAQVNKMP